ncbi:MAG TPA: hypothetical protein VHB73_03260, partial [Alphaproteobacteria bacterium]|nr:hypothetical protein [Alphaproteobacteria bacterium]
MAPARVAAQEALGAQVSPSSDTTDAPKKATSPSKKKKKSKSAPKAAAKKTDNAPVTSDDLMSAMRQTLQPQGAPPAETPAPVEAAPPATPPVTAAAPPPPPPPPPPPKKEEVLIPAPVEKPAKTVAKQPVPVAPKEEKPAAPPPASSNGAPLLSDLEEPPTMLGAPPPDNAASAAPSGKMEEGNYSPPRPLFGKKGGGKRAGVARKSQKVSIEPASVPSPPPPPPPPGPMKATPIPASVPSPPPAPPPSSPPILSSEPAPSLPPVGASPPPVLDPAKSSENTSSGGSKTAPAASSMEGTVIYSQTAPETPAPAAKPSGKQELFVPAPPPSPPEPHSSNMRSKSGLVPPRFAARPHPGMAAAKPILTASTGPPAYCGAANGVGTSLKPASYLCSAGVPSEVQGNGPWRWTCRGERGGASVMCSAPSLVNGECGPANGSQMVSPPPLTQLCASGKSSGLSGAGPWYWTCEGGNGGGMAQCVAYKPENGGCGPANNVPARSAPESGLCASGRETTVIGNGPWSWSCVGTGNAATVTCTAPLIVSAACGPAHGVGVAAPPTQGLCASGNPTTIIGAGPWLWSCQGSNGGETANCMAPLLTSGVCGAAAQMPATSAPKTDLCQSGTASAVAGDGPWSWTCTGTGGGVSVSCQAVIAVAPPPPPAAPTPPATPAPAPVPPASTSPAAA